MGRWEWEESIHWRRSSIERAESFLEKVHLDFHLADLAAELSLLGINGRAGGSRLWREEFGESVEGELLPGADEVRMVAEHLGDLAGGSRGLDGIHCHLGLQDWWVSLAGLGHWFSFDFNADHHSRKGQFAVQFSGSITSHGPRLDLSGPFQNGPKSAVWRRP